MEEAIRYELEQHVPELAPVIHSDGSIERHIFPTHAPETYTKPYLVYYRSRTDFEKDYDGFKDHGELNYLFSCMAVQYSEMKSLTSKVVELLKSFIDVNIGQDQIHVQNVKINNIAETWENELKVNRGIIDFMIYY